jgi:putative ABC transport system ATP-binding protein
MNQTMISIKDLDFRYREGDFRLRIPDFCVEKSEKVAVIGPSGTGKTTLLNLISGINTPESGRISVNGTDVSALGDAVRRDFRIINIGFIFQDFELLDYLNVIDNIFHPYRITSAMKLKNGVRKRATILARAMGLDDKLKRSVLKLSQGEKQRTAICRALLPNPKLILADEATGNLDPENKARILDLLFQSVEEHNATLVAVTHDHELLNRFDRTIDFQDFHETT